jgi:hypothetical protein
VHRSRRGPREELDGQFEARRTLHASGQIVFPGLVDTHTHLYQTLLKGLGDDLPLMEWLDACTLPSIPYLTPRMCYVAAALGCIESLRSGCTTVFDYMVDHPDTTVYDAILKAFDDVGIQASSAAGCATARGRVRRSGSRPCRLSGGLPARGHVWRRSRVAGSGRNVGDGGRRFAGGSAHGHRTWAAHQPAHRRSALR